MHSETTRRQGARAFILTPLALTVILAVTPGAAHADRSYAESIGSMLGPLTVVRLSDDGRRLRYVAMHLRCSSSNFYVYVSTVARIARRMPPMFLDNGAVLVPIKTKRGTVAARLAQTQYFSDGTVSVEGRLVLRNITKAGLTGTWRLHARGVPRDGGAARRCTQRIRFRANAGAYVGATGDTADSGSNEAVMVRKQGDSVFVVVGVYAGCASGSFVWALYGDSAPLRDDGSFGWTTPLDQTMAIFDFNPAQVLLNGQLDGRRASGTFSATVDWEGDLCSTGTVTWKAANG